MKNVIYGVGMGVLTILLIVLIMTINAQSTRQKDGEDALSAAVENAVEKTMSAKDYTIDDNQEFISDFLENLLVQITNDSDIQVDVMGIDVDEGLLSIRVTEIYNNVNGKDGEYEYETTVIFSETVQNNTTYTISYYADDDAGTTYTFATYDLLENSDFLTPTTTPEIEGATFLYWQDIATNEKATFPDVVTEDKEYVAVFEY